MDTDMLAEMIGQHLDQSVSASANDLGVPLLASAFLSISVDLCPKDIMDRFDACANDQSSIWVCECGSEFIDLVCICFHVHIAGLTSCVINGMLSAQFDVFFSAK